MNDFSYVAIIVAFFVLAALFVKACDRIIGADDQPVARPAPEVEAERTDRAA